MLATHQDHNQAFVTVLSLVAGLLLETEALVMTPNGTDSFPSFFSLMLNTGIETFCRKVVAKFAALFSLDSCTGVYTCDL